MFTLNCKGRLLTLDRPLVMGILNLTPDSFYSGSRMDSLDRVLEKAGQMLEQGATILDIGGQSTRPGSERIDAEEEIIRILEPLRQIRKRFQDAFISVDTYYSQVARAAAEAGADIINDISAGSLDPLMIPTVASLKIPYVLMHMKGTPSNMKQEAVYQDVTREVFDFLSFKMAELTKAGIRDIIIDPGFGFSKTIDHNFEMLKNLEVFKLLGAPLLLGLSRKSMIYRTLGISAEEALNGSAVLHTIGLEKGADIIRTHDVKETMEAILLLEAIRQKK